MWKIPKQITTPNFEDDIERLLSTEILRLFKLCDDKEKKMRLHRIVEMLDFADHLMNFSEYLKSINKPTIRIENGTCEVKDNIRFNEHDYSGCEFDIEAFVYYTYVSVIDTSMAKSTTYVSPKSFFMKNIHEGNITKAKVLTLCDEYNKTHGLSRNFKEVFTTRISNELQEKFANGIMVLSDERKTDYTKAEIDKCWAEWQKKDVKDRMKKIASCLYSIRSSYTHSNIRSFIPSLCWDRDTLSHNTKYLIQNDMDLLEMLKSVILELCKELLSSKGH